LGSRIPPV
jgi:hypothetical protein